MTGQLADKVAVITRAGSGVGRATARLFHQQGAKLVLADITGQQREAAGELAMRRSPSERTSHKPSMSRR